MAGLTLRILAEVAYRPALLFNDSIRYLYLSGGQDPVGYRVLLKPVLLVGNLDTVAAVQHLLGLGMAVALYVLLMRRGVPRALAAIATAPVLLDGYQIQMEQSQIDAEQAMEQAEEASQQAQIDAQQAMLAAQMPN